jgi:NADH-quinone oxidoreductase subunit N
MPANLFPTGVEYFRILPEIILTLAGVLAMFMEAVFTNDHQRKIFGPFSIVALLAALAASLAASGDPGAAFSNMLIIDGFASFFRALVIAIGVIAILSSTEYLHREKSAGGEYYALILFSIVGQCVMVTANELIMIFIGLEISSISSYVLAGYLRDDPRNNESALKYFLLGSFATAFLLYGVAWIYGLTGSTNLDHIRSALQTSTPPLVLAGAAAALIFVGIGFKISAAPFQIWAPTFTRARPRQFPDSFPSAPKLPPSRFCCAFS